MAKTRLDRSRYFATEHGEFDDAVRYWQDGLAFDADGKPVKARLTPKLRRLAAEGAVASPPAAPDESAAAAPEAAAPAAPESPPDGEVDLELWLRGGVRYVSTRVFAAVKRRHAKHVTNFAEAVEFLVGEVKLVPPADVAPQLQPKND